MDVTTESNVAADGSINTNGFEEGGEEDLHIEERPTVKNEAPVMTSHLDGHQEESVIERQVTAVNKSEENAEVVDSDATQMQSDPSPKVLVNDDLEEKILQQKKHLMENIDNITSDDINEGTNGVRRSKDGIADGEESPINDDGQRYGDGNIENTTATESLQSGHDTDISEQQAEGDKEKKEEWLDILGNGLLKKKVISEGMGEETRPTTGDEVVLRLSGELENGTKLNEQELVFILDEREVIQALDLAVALMECKEKALLYTDAKYAYGNIDCEEDGVKIPSKSNITYQLELMQVAKREKQSSLSDERCISIGERKRTRGNNFYSRGDYGGAIDCYSRAVKYLEGSTNKDVIEMLLKCQNNLSAAQIKINAFQAALNSCNSVLNLEPDNVKANFRKGKCLEKIGEAEEALKWMKKASMLDPNSKVIQGELIRIGNYVKKNRQNESMMYKRMVEGLKKDGEKKETNDDNLSLKIMVGTLIVAGIGILAGFIWYKR